MYNKYYVTFTGKDKKDKDKSKRTDGGDRSEKGEKGERGEKGDKSEKGDKGEKESKCAEEKRKHIKSLIDKIPTQKEQLFQYQLDTDQIDNVLMEKKIRPWINKKIIEYIGEPEPTLVDFICSKVLAGSAPQGILDDVQMVLDEEAEVFVVKMWRLLIYELEAKRAGLHK
ncbi:jg14152 [Pararge aegeria aegeria]|uniref:Jg14152 protein n=1 Tax=Pararge aegeria aegeria TaxID=348720 RepID=A0A8S4QX46_9NEOP|nr:jg14152 [Pararge aegeria aegeria]